MSSHRISGLAAACLAVVGMIACGGDHPLENVGTAESANLSGSTFEGNDGNLVVNTAGNKDWANVPGRATGIDQPSGTSDNAFGGGTKEDNPQVNIVDGSIPPNKNDLTRFYEASEFVNGANYLYLAWERLVNIGNANLDFEINQKRTTGFTGTTTGSLTLNRTAGDLLITYDFGGSGSPTLGLLKWVTSGPTSQCFASNSLPCWGNRVDLSAAGFAEGAVNTVSVTEPIAGGSLGVGLFGEAAINLTAAGVFPAGTCTAFGSVFVKSRSSSSFTAELKDFIAPQPINISNCGSVIIRKTTVPSPDPTNTSFAYTTTGGLTPATFSLKDGGKQDYGANVAAGSYTVTESSPGSNFALTAIDCSASVIATAPTTNTGTRTVSFDLKPNDVLDCTFVNTLQLGAIKITKVSSKAAATPLAGAKFSITSGGNPISGSPFTTGADGTICVDNLAFGNYVVTETAAPSGHSIDDTTAHTITVDNAAKCSDSTFVGETITFKDTPLTDIQCKATSQASGGTKSTIKCVNSSNQDVAVPVGPGESVTLSANGLKPDTYTCTIVVVP